MTEIESLRAQLAAMTERAELAERKIAELEALVGDGVDSHPRTDVIGAVKHILKIRDELFAELNAVRDKMRGYASLADTRGTLLDRARAEIAAMTERIANLEADLNVGQRKRQELRDRAALAEQRIAALVGALRETYPLVKRAFVSMHDDGRRWNDVDPGAQVRIKAALREHIDAALALPKAQATGATTKCESWAAHALHECSHSAAPPAPTPVSDPIAPVDAARERRYFVDHGMWHDRKTGRHLDDIVSEVKPSERLATLLLAVAGYEQTPKEAHAELEADGIDVNAFLARVHDDERAWLIARTERAEKRITASDHERDDAKNAFRSAWTRAEAAEKRAAELAEYILDWQASGVEPDGAVDAALRLAAFDAADADDAGDDAARGGK